MTGAMMQALGWRAAVTPALRMFAARTADWLLDRLASQLA